MSWSDGLVATDSAYMIAGSSNSRVRVVAGPGTGKSFAMKRRVARLLEEGVEPSAILPVTFTRVAATDLHRELVGMGVPGCDELRAFTLHSLALQILMRNSVLKTIGRVPRTLNAFELEPFVSDLARANGGKKRTRELISAYEAGWARLQHDEPGYAPTSEDQEFAQELVRWMMFHEAMLIGEVVPHLYGYLKSNPAAAERTEFAHILVDEFQDLNRAEQELIALLSDAADVCIVGDDDQSIYSFKYAHPEGIRDWLSVNAGAEDLGLEDCRRCPTRVVEMANNLISWNQLRPVPRVLNPMPENGEGDIRILQYRSIDEEVVGITRIVAELLRDRIDPGEILILTQSRAFGTPIYEALRAGGVPTASYFAESELVQVSARKAYALLALLLKPEDSVALRWLIGLGGNDWNSAGYARVREHCEATGSTPWETLSQLESGELTLPYTGRVVAAFSDVRKELESLAELEDFASIVDRLFPEGYDATRDLRELALGIMSEHEDLSRDAFILELRSATSKPEIPTEVEEVRIMSLHKSKGLSAPVTIIAGCVQGLLPRAPQDTLSISERQQYMEEQRRLFYVGITRVKASPREGRPGTLVLTYSQEMPTGAALAAGITPASHRGGRARLHASQFIQELGHARPTPSRA